MLLSITNPEQYGKFCVVTENEVENRTAVGWVLLMALTKQATQSGGYQIPQPNGQTTYIDIPVIVEEPRFVLGYPVESRVADLVAERDGALKSSKEQGDARIKAEVAHREVVQKLDGERSYSNSLSKDLARVKAELEEALAGKAKMEADLGRVRFKIGEVAFKEFLKDEPAGKAS